jgi:hypothetical protein
MVQNLSARVASLQDLGIAAYLAPRYRLRVGPFLDPRWFARYSRGFFDCTVDTTGAIALGSEKLVPEESRGFQPRERVVVFCDRWFYGVRFTDAVCHQEVLERERTQRLKDEESSRDRSMADAKDFNSLICIPVNWDVAIRDVLSGLKENSIGDGRNAATVEHILLLEPLACGRLKRGKGDLLCASNRKLNGKNWSGQRTEWRFGSNGEQYKPKVTCKSCLRLVQRWISKNAG